MKATDVKKLAETVEAGLRDGRTLGSLRKAMGEAGYKEADIRQVISNVDRKKTVRRPKRKREYNKGWIAASILIIVVVLMGSYIFWIQPGMSEETETGFPGGNASSGKRICYVVNESVKQDMIDAGAQCDKWYLIREI